MKTLMNYELEYGFITDAGKVRLSNQDNVKIIKNKFGDILMVVADGMGGHNKGDYASKLCVDFLEEKFLNYKRQFKSKFISKFWLKYIINKCNRFIYKTAEQSKAYKGMGTTVVATLIFNNKVINVNVGDSRAYIIKNNKISLFSEDQSYVKFLESSGQISQEEAKKRKDNNILLCALGIQPTTNQNVKSMKYLGETFLLCSDGLFHVLKDEEILNIVNQNKDINSICKELIDAANLSGGPDNISVALLRSK